MANITYIESNGVSTTVTVPDGWSLMQAATANGVEGILGECGGSCACATCHCYVDDRLMALLPAPDTDELGLLSNVAAQRKPNSRLACQIKVSVALEGGIIRLPEYQA